LYLMSSNGGEAIPLTVDESHDHMPVWSADSKWIAFASDKYGNFDVFIISSSGGVPKRLTYHASHDYPSSFTPDGQEVVFNSQRLDMSSYAQFPNRRMPELYSIKAKGGRPEMLLTSPAVEAIYSAEGNKIYYQDQKGYEDPWRKHHTSSIARDIWVYDIKDQRHTKLTTFEGEDRDPALAADSQTLFYLSEQSGSFNVHSMTLSNPTSTTQLTQYQDHPVRFLSISQGGTLCYGYNGELYTLEEGQQPKKLEVNVLAVRENLERKILPISGEITEMALSPNGKEIATVVRGEIFVSSVENGTTKRVTNTPEQERSVSFSPDGKSLVYASERNNSWNVYRAKLSRAEEKYFYSSTLLDEQVVVATSGEEFQPSFSPDGKEVAYLYERTELRVIDLDSKAVRTIVPGNRNYSYSDGDQSYHWSPDGQWFLVNFLPQDHWIAEVGLVDAQGKNLHNLTWSGYQDWNPQWMMDGKMMIWYSDRDGMKNHASWGSEGDIYGMFFTQDAFDRFNLDKADFALLKEKEEESNKSDQKEKKDDEEESLPEIQIDLDGLEERKSRLTIHSSRLAGAVLSEDGETLYYLARFEKGLDLWKTELRTKETKILAKLGSNETSDLEISGDGKNIFVLGDGKVFKVDTKSGEKKPLQIKGEMELKKQGEWAYIFDHAWRQVQKKFYRTDLHGVDWNFYRTAYQRFLPHISNNHEFAEMLSEMLGELNVSHTGCRYRPRSKTADGTASVGLFFDHGHTGTGLEVTEVLPGGPADKASSRISNGTILEKIDGTLLTSEVNHCSLLNRKSGDNMLLSFYHPKTKERWDEVVKPISRGQEYNLLYKRWVTNRRKEVEAASGGKVGYVHVRSMNDGSYRTVFEEVLGKNANKESLIVDTRSNGGGWLHDDLATFLSGTKYLEMAPRGQRVGFEPQRKWTKPTALLIGENNYSDAHMFPYAYQTQKLGVMVGMPVPGTGTAVWWERQIDPTLVFGIPQVGMIDVEGDYLENKQLEPDVKVKNSYEKLVLGTDEQLQKAVELLLATAVKKPEDAPLEQLEKGDK
ncbi:MAG: PD40 domain-containing protein, partial [Cyclobacteriaceae bacterium]|nr:PD40 domain-containing protein [Cyclobacteriaceae bacterium HetDA_MAG_MS6]